MGSGFDSRLMQIFCFQQVANPFSINLRKSRTNGRCYSSYDRDVSKVENVEEEWASLLAAEEKNKEEMQRLYKKKLDEWKAMKSAGILDKLQSQELSQETIDEMDELSDRLIKDRVLLKKQNSEKSEDIDEKDKIINDLQEKLKLLLSKKDSGLAIYNLFNEVKDKGLATGQTPFMEDILMALSRQGSEPHVAASYEIFNTLTESQQLSPSEGFHLRFVTSCASNGLTEFSRNTASTLLSSKLATSIQLLPSVLSTEIYDIIQKKPVFKSKATTKLLLHQRAQTSSLSPVDDLASVVSKNAQQKVNVLLDVLRKNIKEYTVAELNVVIRMLGKLKLIEEIFELLDAMRVGGVPPNDESLEFLANAIILFAGRSNVGKSSLVNLICNRKTLASTSATPGHTKAFHFFCVNKDRVDVPSFHIVDVPGMGYAEAANNTQDSWRSLLERYVTIREPLVAVCHLVDSRHKLTTTDKQIIDMMTRAAAAREAAGRTKLLYTVILTKTDRASLSEYKESMKDVLEGTAALAGVLGLEGGVVPVLGTSAVDKTGRDGLWRLLQGVIRGKKM
eukprot:gene4276-8511_t